MRDIDAEMVAACRDGVAHRNVDLVQADYLVEDHSGYFDYAILNPPWVRQEWIAKKDLYRDTLQQRYDLVVPGTANLYVYFLVRVVHDLKPGGRFVAVTYDSWKATRYGQWLMQFLVRNCEDLLMQDIHHQPFEGRLVDATIISGTRRRSPAPEEDTRSRVTPPAGYARLGDLVESQRGLRLKQASFFMTSLAVPGATPFVKKLKGARGYALPSNHSEWALLAENQENPGAIELEVERRLAKALREPDANKSVLTWFHERPTTWSTHRPAPRAPILFNYYIRNAPRHIRSDGRAYADNFYGITPRGTPVDAVIALLNSTQVRSALCAHARNQGNGLRKLQLFEYRDVVVPDWTKFPSSAIARLRDLGASLVSGSDNSSAVLELVDHTIDGVLRGSLRPDRRSP
jgi:hypothetical protein